MDDHLREFVNPDQPFGPIVAPTIGDYEAFASLFDTSNAIARELNKRPALIIGRRGAGKTAFLNSLSLDSTYAIVVPLEPGEAFPSMIRCIEQKLPGNILPEEVALLWENLLWGGVFKQLLAAHPAAATELLPVARYLEGLGVTEGMSFYSVMRAILNAVAQLNRRLKVLVDAIEELTSRGVTFRDARDCAEAFLRERGARAVILMDSLEQFPLDEPAMAKTMTGLIRAVGQFNRPGGRQCEIRCCLPSELYPRLTRLSSNPLKDFETKVLLQWRPHELLHMAALRYLHFIRLYAPAQHRKRFAAVDISRRDGLHAFWSSILAPCVTNGIGADEDGIAYLMRHTQLLPRHVLLYLNDIARRALTSNGGDLFLDERCVVEGVRASQHLLCKEIFSGFRQTYPEAEEICVRLLPNVPMVFRVGDLHKAFNRNRGHLGGLDDYHDALAVLLRIGAVGVVTAETDRYTRAIFDYTLPDNLHYRADDAFCIHPIFVEEYRVADAAKGGRLKPVYPEGSEVEIGRLAA